MSDQLESSKQQAGPDDVQAVRLRLIEASENALVNSDPKCLVYGALASALSESADSDDEVWTGLITAVYSASTAVRAANVVMDIIEELKDPASDPSGRGVPAALANELTLATLLYVVRRLEGKRDLDTLDQGIPPDWSES